MATDKAILVKDLLPKIQTLNSVEKPVSVFGFTKWNGNKLKTDIFLESAQTDFCATWCAPWWGR